MPPINSQQLLNRHLGASDNAGIALRQVKPFTPDDFPAVRKYEQVIKDLPVEHAYAFDSTGMPIGHSMGSETAVASVPIDRTVDGAPVSVVTHNHPAHLDQVVGLSDGDIKHSVVSGVPIRGVIPKANRVDEFRPGGTPSGLVWESDLGEMLDTGMPARKMADALKGAYPGYREGLVNPQMASTDYRSYINNPNEYPEAYRNEDIARQVASDAEFDNRLNLKAAEKYRNTLPATINPTYESYGLSGSAPDAQMATDSFAIKRKPLITIDPSRSSAGSYVPDEYNPAYMAMMEDRLGRYGY